MSDDQWDNNDPQDQNQGKGLRAQLERALGEIATLKESNAKLEKQARQATISSLLREKGLNPKIAKLIPTDVESTEEALNKWYEENKDLFPAPPDNKGTTDTNSEPNEDETLTPEQLAEAQQLTAMGTVTGQSIPPQRQQDLIAQINKKDLTYDQLMDMITSAGGGYGTG